VEPPPAPAPGPIGGPAQSSLPSKGLFCCEGTLWLEEARQDTEVVAGWGWAEEEERSLG
jgi:hypothetical protein